MAGKPGDEVLVQRQRKYKILVVDDERLSRDLIEASLTRSGFHVLSVPNGLKLISFLKVNKPDLVILDIAMSWINGFDLCRLLCGLRGFDKIPIVFVSGYATPENIEQGYASGAVDFIAKPFDVQHLVQRVKHHLGVKTVLPEST